MGAEDVKGMGTREDPWLLKTPPGTSEYQMCRTRRPTRRRSCARSGRRAPLPAALHRRPPAMLKDHGDWMPLGSADEQKPAAEGTVEAWGRSEDEPGRRLVRA